MRISLKDLLAIVAFCAVVLTCATFVGFDNGVFWFAVIVSGVMSLIFSRLVSNPKRRSRGLLASVPVLILSLLFVSFALALNAVMLIAAGVYMARRPPPSARTIAQAVMLSMLGGLAVGMLIGLLETQSLMKARQNFPLVSVRERLAYEPRIPPSTSISNVALKFSVLKRLDDFESESSWSLRDYQLKRIHDHAYEGFVRSFGFGVGRMMPPRFESIVRPDLRNIQINETEVHNFDWNRGDWKAFWRSARSDAIDHLYTVSHDDFLDADTFGAMPDDKLQVAGFVPHALHYPPLASLEDPHAWTIERLELVSLLKFDEPRVYVLDHLPRMDQLSGDTVPTRSLDKFETTSLEQLRTDEDLVIAHEGPAYRMLGSLRTVTQCLNCHTAQRGELLGAFSYALRTMDASGGE